MSPTLPVICHVDDPSYGTLERSAARAGRALEPFRAFAGDRLPEVSGIDALVVLGGPQSAYDLEANPYLGVEIDYLRAAHARGVPILALCLGSHLLAQALGGTCIPGPNGLECGFIDVRSTTTEPTTELPLAGRFFSFHTDTALLPPEAEELAATDRYVQSWRVATSLAIQFHPELDASGIDALLAIEDRKLTDHGIDVAALRRSVDDELAEPNPGRILLDAWFDTLPGADTTVTRSSAGIPAGHQPAHNS